MEAEAIKEEKTVRKEGHCDKNFNSLIPAAEQFKPNDSSENGNMNEY